MNQYLKATHIYDYNDKAIQRFIADQELEKLTSTDRAIKLHDVVRDSWYYNPYKMHFSSESCKASTIFSRSEGHCLDKATLLVTVLRAVDIPARLHLAKVKNHIAVEHIIEVFKTDVLTPHGYVEVYLNDQWVAATPAFNKSLCEKLGVDVLAFNGQEDAIFQQYDPSGQRFMEYIEDYGTFDDFPIEFVKENIIQHYPQLMDIVQRQGSCDLKTF